MDFISDEITHCWAAFDGSHARPIWDDSTYEYLRETYVDIVNDDDDDKILDLKDAKNGLRVPYEARYIPGKSRGLFATEDIPKGTLMWDESDHVFFDNEEDWYDYLDEIGYDMACDIIQWAYVESCSQTTNNKDDDNDNDHCYQVAVDLGPSSLINTAEESIVNFVACSDMSEDVRSTIPGCSSGDATYATRDIKAGEEILTTIDKEKDGEIYWFADTVWYAWEFLSLGEEL
mmetsp:Transcript_41129/g.46740  ORF Transcript_41129/g.46740 Transcript_41129/m.46740 type:complete len:232 (-) Transcript_41129:140-835(-)|eukprot:CAMPEP_0194139186 /NCGR_PEP_ID=MMETSP0152-20130528/8911_1 /TAXON_ID=1049557 /ORGANISM="Thalassiothrix antarctica, Strain L6-D1" /LENGTH=231 /DNA_ID=CAMNT_0038836963 /DNA_START=34 /DNA_END=729 /DNA_ORIENTATION=-